ncbi:hypothetical protein [Accumulibacter sp.]|uniref:hypothetical protein n=1 Tax=Accumulibacter sp. TaxID=2053492 RepID=UPI00338DCC11
MECAGSDKTRLLMVTIYLRDIDDMIARTRSGTDGSRAEPRFGPCLRRSELSNCDYLIEIAVVAAR